MKTNGLRWAKVFVHCLVGVSFAGLSGLGFCDEAGKKKDDPFGWSIRSYRISGDIFAYGFIPNADPFHSKEEKLPKLPQMPSATATGKEIEKFITSSSKAFELLIDKHGISLPKGSLAAFDLDHDTLAVRTNGETHEQLETWTKNHHKLLPSLCEFGLEILELDNDKAVDLMSKAISLPDHSALYTQIGKQVKEGKARWLSESKTLCKPGHEVKIESGSEKRLNSPVLQSGNDAEAGIRSSRLVGLTVEIIPVVGADYQTLDLTLSTEFHLSSPTSRLIPIPESNGKLMDRKVSDFHVARTLTNLAMKDGQTRIVGCWPHSAPGEAAKKHVLAFLTGKIVKPMKSKSPVAANWLREHGEKVVPTPPMIVPDAEDPAPEVIPGADDPASKMIVKRFEAHSSFLEVDHERNDEPTDPFSTPEHNQKTLTAQEILEANNISFPAGASAVFVRRTNELVVRNTPMNLSLVEALMASTGYDGGVNVRFLLHIVQADGAVLRKLNKKSSGLYDHSEIWRELQDEVKADRASILQTNWIDSKPGMDTNTSAVKEYVYADSNQNQQDGSSKDAPKKSDSGNGSIRPRMKTRYVGTTWEILPVFGADGSTIDSINRIEFHTATPLEHFTHPNKGPKSVRSAFPEVDFHVFKSTFNTSMRSGTMRMVGIWQPKGTQDFEKGDILQAAFIKAQVVINE